MKIPVIIFALMFVLFSCKKENLDNYDGISYPKSTDSIDMDGNGTNDFYIKYYQISTLDIPVSASTVGVEIFPVGLNRILDSPDEKPMFLSKNDTIWKMPNPLEWTKYSRGLMSNSWDGETWAEHWTIHSESNEYYIGYKIANAGVDKVGWVMFEFDTAEGTYTVIDKKSANSDFILTGN